MEINKIMSVLQRISRNIFFKTLGEGGSRILSFVFVFYCARKLGKVEFGKYSLVYSYTGMFLILIDLGLNTLLVRDVGADHSRIKKYLANYISIKSFLAILSWLLMVIIAWFLYDEPEKLHLIRIMGFFTITLGFSEFSYAIFSSLEQMQHEAFLKIMNRFLVFGFGIIALALGFGLAETIYSMLAGGVLSVVVGWGVIIKKVSKIDLECDLHFNWNLIKEAFPLSLMAIFIVLYSRLNVVMLSKLGASDAEIAWFASAVRLIDMLGVIPALAVTAMLPVFASLYQDSRELLITVYQKAFKMLFTLGFLVTLIIFFLANPIIESIYGAEFIPGASALRWLVWVSMLMFVNRLLLNVLIVIHLQRLNALSSGLCVVINIILNLILIPRLNFIGASITTVVTELVFFGLNFYFISKYFYHLKFWKLTYKTIIAGILLVGTILLLHNFHLFLAIGAGVIIFIGTLFLLQDFSKDELKSFQNLFRGVFNR